MEQLCNYNSKASNSIKHLDESLKNVWNRMDRTSSDNNDKFLLFSTETSLLPIFFMELLVELLEVGATWDVLRFSVELMAFLFPAELRLEDGLGVWDGVGAGGVGLLGSAAADLDVAEITKQSIHDYS